MKIDLPEIKACPRISFSGITPYFEADEVRSKIVFTDKL